MLQEAYRKPKSFGGQSCLAKHWDIKQGTWQSSGGPSLSVPQQELIIKPFWSYSPVPSCPCPWLYIEGFRRGVCSTNTLILSTPLWVGACNPCFTGGRSEEQGKEIIWLSIKRQSWARLRTQEACTFLARRMVPCCEQVEGFVTRMCCAAEVLIPWDRFFHLLRGLLYQLALIGASGYSEKKAEDVWMEELFRRPAQKVSPRNVFFRWCDGMTVGANSTIRKKALCFLWLLGRTWTAVIVYLKVFTGSMINPFTQYSNLIKACIDFPLSLFFFF